MRPLSPWILIAFLFVVVPAATPAWTDESPAQVHILPMEKNFPAERLKRPGVEIHRGKSIRFEKSTIPNAQERDRLFEKAGLTSDVQGWDHLDRDLLYQKAIHYSSSELQKRYPKIAPEKLTRLQELLKGSS